MANYNKNILIGTGGRDSINRSHYLGAVYGMERIMGRAENPVRSVLNYASDHFLSQIPIVYVLTVVGYSGSGSLAVRGLFIGDDIECFRRAAKLKWTPTLPEYLRSNGLRNSGLGRIYQYGRILLAVRRSGNTVDY